jgi:hypothetical protein
MADPNLKPGHPDYVCPPSEHDPFPQDSLTAYQKHRRYAAEHRDDGFYAPVSSDDPPPRHSR